MNCRSKLTISFSDNLLLEGLDSKKLVLENPQPSREGLNGGWETTSEFGFYEEDSSSPRVRRWNCAMHRKVVLVTWHVRQGWTDIITGSIQYLPYLCKYKTQLCKRPRSFVVSPFPTKFDFYLWFMSLRYIERVWFV